MEVISSIYNSGYNIKKFYLGSRELNLAYLGNQVIYDEVIGDNDLNYILYEFYGSDTLPNTVEAPVKSAILKGNTKYRDIDTGDILDTFDETKNLELVSVKMPVLRTSNNDCYIINIEKNCYYTAGAGKFAYSANFDTYNVYVHGLSAVKLTSDTELSDMSFWGDNNQYISGGGSFQYTFSVPSNAKYFKVAIRHVNTSLTVNGFDIINDYKSNILTVNEDVTLRSNGDVYDELNLLTGRLTQRIDENNEVLAQAVVKTVDLTIVDQDGKTINKLNSFNGTTHISTEVAENSAYPMVSLEVASELQAAMSKVTEDIELIKPVQNDIETTLDTQSNDIDSLLLATTELFEMIL